MEIVNKKTDFKNGAYTRTRWRQSSLTTYSHACDSIITSHWDDGAEVGVDGEGVSAFFVFEYRNSNNDSDDDDDDVVGRNSQAMVYEIKWTKCVVSMLLNSHFCLYVAFVVAAVLIPCSVILQDYDILFICI